MTTAFEAVGTNKGAAFTLKVYRGEGMALLAMNWKAGPPHKNFVGFAIEFKAPDGPAFHALRNRLRFPNADGSLDPNPLSTLDAPIQMFRWVHFPFRPELPGVFTYRVTPMFMDAHDHLSPGPAQEAAIELGRETYPGLLNVCFTRGFVSSQAFVDRFESAGPISTLLPSSANEGLRFTPTHPKTQEALSWMGFEARAAILGLLDDAVADTTAKVKVVAYDLSEPDVVARLETLGPRLQIIIDDSGFHGEKESGETQSARRLAASAGPTNVKRQHMANLQHNKTIVVDGAETQAVACGSTNFSWRGFFVQANNALILRGSGAVAHFAQAFDAYWTANAPTAFRTSPSARWKSLGLPGITAKVAFSPHSADNAVLKSVASDIRNTTSSLFYSLAFLYQTTGPVLDAITAVTAKPGVFVYGISDRKVGGLDVTNPDGNVSAVFPSELSGNLPEPFKHEPSGGSGIRMHHKFVVIDFDKPTARVYLGSYNFSAPADLQNGENLLLIEDRRIAVAYMVEALRIFDHYHFRVAQKQASQGLRSLELARPPRTTAQTAWWNTFYTDARKIRDRELFAK